MPFTSSILRAIESVISRIALLMSGKATSNKVATTALFIMSKKSGLPEGDRNQVRVTAMRKNTGSNM
jgi:tRNA pseudouridine-54 N-methylase